MKICIKCGIEKPSAEFYRHATSTDGFRSDCKTCRLDYQKSHGPRYRKNVALKLAYGITIERYDYMLREQEGKCAICKTDRCITDRQLCVDHDHKTGEVRGLLCSNCNRAIGLLSDSPHNAISAAQYLLKYREE